MNNIGDVDGMRDDIKAIYYYYSISTDEELCHKYSTKGEYTSCSYNKYKHEAAKDPETKYPDRVMPEHKHNTEHRIPLQ